MAIRRKTFTINRDGVEHNGVTYNNGDPVEGAALAALLEVRPDLLDEHKPPTESTKETK